MYENTVNCPALCRAVTATIAISTGCVNTSFQARADSAAGFTPLGSAAKTHSAAVQASSEMKPKATRQLKVSPSHEAIGMPSTEASDQPTKMKVMARPRCSGAAMKPTAAAACGVNTAAPSIVSARSGHSAA